MFLLNKKYIFLLIIIFVSHIFLIFTVIGKNIRINDEITLIVDLIEEKALPKVKYNPPNIHIGSLVFISISHPDRERLSIMKDVVLHEKIKCKRGFEKNNSYSFTKTGFGHNQWFEINKVFVTSGEYEHTFRIIYDGIGTNNFTLPYFNIPEKRDQDLELFLNKKIEICPFKYLSSKSVIGYKNIYEYIQRQEGDWDFNFSKISKLTNIKIKIIGHTGPRDLRYNRKNKKSKGKNYLLSLKRARVVRDVLINCYGIKKNRIIIEGKASKKLKYAVSRKSSPSQIRRNRRIEMTFIDN